VVHLFDQGFASAFWRVVFAYLRRWQSELAWRFAKSELAEHSSASVALAGAHEAVGHGDRGLRLSLASAGSAL
jgi:hypothetical protein